MKNVRGAWGGNKGGPRVKRRRVRFWGRGAGGGCGGPCPKRREAGSFSPGLLTGVEPVGKAENVGIKGKCFVG